MSYIPASKSAGQRAMRLTAMRATFAVSSAGCLLRSVAPERAANRGRSPTIECARVAASRLNRVHRLKADTFVLDFRNDTDDIVKAFEPYDGWRVVPPTDPNLLYDAACLDRRPTRSSPR